MLKPGRAHDSRDNDEGHSSIVEQPFVDIGPRFCAQLSIF